MNNKQFFYEVQEYQEKCISNIVDILGQVSQNHKFDEVMKEHCSNNGYNLPINSKNRNIDIMMETGTGKTFTFIKLMFELNRNFNYKKFIILIPSVAIREGTKSNLEDTREYFKSYYANEREKEIDIHIYESGKTSEIVSYINNTNLSVLVMTPDSFNRDTNILNKPLLNEIYTPEVFANDSTPPKSYLECLKRLNPIVIIDEPHKFDGDAFKEKFMGFNNYYFRFGATFPVKTKNKENTIPLSNVAYILNSINAFRDNLVKRIVVYTEDVVTNQDTFIGTIKDKNTYKAIVNNIVNGVVLRRELSKGAIFNDKSIKKINKSSLILNDGSSEGLKVEMDYTLSDDTLRTMIRNAIKIHFDKEKELFDKNVKALSLFFIKNDISLFRGDTPTIKNIFEEEYINIREDIISKLDENEDKDYYNYLLNDFDSDNNLQVHKGYFSGDKGNKDDKIKQGVDEILSDKKKLLSFDSPTRFIFSIWALQEGWDNPNVFTICKLSNQGSDISKLQQIGRGLRIAVNQDLKRKTIGDLDGNQEEFWNINNLDVIVSNQEYGFVESIQSEILRSSNFVTSKFRLNDLVLTILGKSSLNDLQTRKLVKMLESNELVEFQGYFEGIPLFAKADNYSQLLEGLDLTEYERKVLESLFSSVAENYVKYADKATPKKNLVIKNVHLKAFEELWSSINKNAHYILDTLNDEGKSNLINNIRQKIEELNIEKILLQTEKHSLQIDKISNNISAKIELINVASYQSKIDYIEFVKGLSNTTKTPIKFIVEIFNGLSDNFKNIMIIKNPAQASREITEIIKSELVQSIRSKISYEGINGAVLPNIFKTENGTTYLEKGTTGRFQKLIEYDFNLKSKWVFEEVIEYDSEFEMNIVENDPLIESIEVFAKLPKLKIKTPLGEYNPDFCYAIKSNNGNKLILVVEAKGYDSSTAIPPDEKSKIDFAKIYFNSLNNYYKDTNIKIYFKERINRTQLANLIPND